MITSSCFHEDSGSEGPEPISCQWDLWSVMTDGLKELKIPAALMSASFCVSQAAAGADDPDGEFTACSYLHCHRHKVYFWRLLEWSISEECACKQPKSWLRVWHHLFPVWIVGSVCCFVSVKSCLIFVFSHCNTSASCVAAVQIDRSNDTGPLTVNTGPPIRSHDR